MAANVFTVMVVAFAVFVARGSQPSVVLGFITLAFVVLGILGASLGAIGIRRARGRDAYRRRVWIAVMMVPIGMLALIDLLVWLYPPLAR